MTAQDDARAELEKVADEIRRARTRLDKAIAKRFDVVERARAANFTWREAANILDMTETGLMKTQSATKNRSAGA